MIYTVTLNPSIDYVMHLDHFEEGTLNRASDTQFLPGGKGINVSQILSEMNIENTALGFSGQFTGSFIKDALEAKAIQTDFIEIDQPSRINIKLKTQTETEINAPGPVIAQDKLDLFLEKISHIRENDVIILSGSLSQGLPNDIYKQIAQIAETKQAQFIVDAEDHLLKQTLQHKPLLIKPNHHELGELFEVEITSAEQALHYAKKLLEEGPQSIIVSFAGDGALYVSKEKVFFAHSPKGIVKNSVGAGDSLVAAFVGKYLEKNNVLDAFRYGVASGSATAFSESLARKEEIEELVNRIQIEDWSDK